MDKPYYTNFNSPPINRLLAESQFWYGTFNAILNTIMCTLFVFFFQVCCKMVAVTIFLWILQNQSSEQSSLEPNFQHGFPKVFFMSLWTKPIKIKTGEVSVGPTCGLYLSWSIPKGYWTLPTLINIGLDINLSAVIDLPFHAHYIN